MCMRMYANARRAIALAATDGRKTLTKFCLCSLTCTDDPLGISCGLTRQFGACFLLFRRRTCASVPAIRLRHRASQLKQLGARSLLFRDEILQTSKCMYPDDPPSSANKTTRCVLFLVRRTCQCTDNTGMWAFKTTSVHGLSRFADVPLHQNNPCILFRNGNGTSHTILACSSTSPRFIFIFPLSFDSRRNTRDSLVRVSPPPAVSPRPLRARAYPVPCDQRILHRFREIRGRGTILFDSQRWSRSFPRFPPRRVFFFLSEHQARPYLVSWEFCRIGIYNIIFLD